jgi:hypothetical protein
MTTEQFHQLEPGHCFFHQAKDRQPKKQFCLLKREGETLIAHLRNDPNFLIHFYPRQASQLTKLDDATPDAVEAIARSQGIPILSPAPLPGESPKTVCIDMEGVLAEPRPASAELGLPIPGAIDFLVACREAGHHVKLCTNRDVRVARHWLQMHSGESHLEDIEIIHVTPTDVYLSTKALRFDGAFPSIDQLQ